MKHDVAFNIGVQRVVCTCGADFKAHQWMGDGFDAVALWATHLAATATKGMNPPPTPGGPVGEDEAGEVAGRG
jgi:hypothetical protein